MAIAHHTDYGAFLDAVEETVECLEMEQAASEERMFDVIEAAMKGLHRLAQARWHYREDVDLVLETIRDMVADAQGSIQGAPMVIDQLYRETPQWLESRS